MTKKKDFFEELKDRKVFREIKAYLFGGATMIPLIWLIAGLLNYDKSTVTMVTQVVVIIFISLFPSVILFAYHHGESKDAPWSKWERIGIPANIFLTVSLVIFFYNSNAIASEFETVQIINPLTQKMEEREIVKSEFKKRLRVCYFENHSGDTSLNWMQGGIMEACDIDLDQESYISNYPFYWYRFSEKYEYGENIRLSSYLEEAKRSNTQYLLKGDFNKTNEIYSVNYTLIDVKTAKNISQKNFKGDNFFSLIDSISHHVKLELLSKKYVENNIDLPISSQLTNSLLAYKYYTLASELYYNEKYEDDDLETKKELYLYNKAIESDARFAQAYRACIRKYDNTNKPDSVDIYWKKVIENIENYPEKERYSIRYGYLRYTKNYEQAFELLKSWAILYPEEIESHSSLAWYYDEQEMYEEAINEFKKCISIDSLSAYYYNNISRIYQFDLKDYEKAIKWKRKYANISGDKYASYRSIASFYDNMRELDSVKYYYNKALLIKPAEFYINRILLTLEMLDVTDFNIKKKKWLELMQYAKDEGDSLIVISDIEQFLEQQGQYNKASILNDSIKEIQGLFWDDNKETKKMSLLYNSFNYLAPKGKYKEAVDIINAMSNFVDSIDPTSSLNKEKNISIKKHSESTIGKVAGFYAVCLYSLANDFNLPKEYNYLISDLYEEIEKIEENKESMFISFGKETKDFTKARLLALDGNYAEAIKLCEPHRSEGSGDWYLIQMARYYQQIKEYKKAGEIFEIIINKPNLYSCIYGSPAENNYYAALLYHDWGKQEKAEKHLNIALEIWKDADEDYVYANMAKETAIEWGIDYLP